MITVVNKPVFTTDCPCCVSTLTYDGTDIEDTRMGTRKCSPIYEYTITCPICGTRITHNVENE